VIPAVLLLMFSLQSRPDPVRSTLSPDGFDVATAATEARKLIEEAPDRRPGSDGDDAAAEYLIDRFQAIEGGRVAEQRFNGEFDGDDVEMRNISLLLPGETDRTIAVLAHRDSAEGTGAATSAAATGALLELAEDFSGARHTKSLLFVSTDGGSAGAAGAKALAKSWPGGVTPETVVVIDQPAAERLSRPFVRVFSDGRESGSAQLEQSAAIAVTDQAGDPGADTELERLLRLAVPAGLGEEAPLIESGLDAVGLSSAGELPLQGTEAERLSETTLEEFGRATLSLILALDATQGPLEHGPDAYTELAGNLVPGWTLTLIAILLLIPVGAVAVEGLARAMRRDDPAIRSLAWIVGRSFAFLACLALVYLLALAGLIPTPPFPFDPARYGIDAKAIIALVLLVALFAAIAVASRPLRLPRGAERTAVGPALAAAVFLAGLGVWAANPYLALLAVPTAHLWMLAGLPTERLPGLGRLLLFAAGFAVPAFAAGVIAGRLGVGLELPWTALVMVADGQIGPVTAFLGCLWGGCGLAALAVAVGRPAPSPPPSQEPESGEVVEPSERDHEPVESDELRALAFERFSDDR